MNPIIHDKQTELEANELRPAINRSEDEKAPTIPHPVALLSGKFSGEEWEALLEAIRCNRRKLDAEEEAQESDGD